MRVLGIDLSLNATGLAMIEPVTDSLPFYVEWTGRFSCHETYKLGDQEFCFNGALILPRSTNVLMRWDQILLPILDWAQHAQHVIIEGYAFSSFGQGVTGMAEMKGIVLYHLRKLGHVPIAITPASLKKFLTNNGRAKKPEILKAVRETVSSIYDHNMADAFGLAQIGCAIYQTGLDLPRHQAETVYRITHPEDKNEKRKHIRVLKFEKANAKQAKLSVH